MTEVVTVTPQLARRWLCTNPMPLRRGSLHRIEAYARDMREGRWDASRSVIDMRGGVLHDGHHRCKAAVKYGLTFETTVRR